MENPPVVLGKILSRLPKDLSQYLPPVVLGEILSRLPKKDLFQCKCVCKFWYETILDPQCVKFPMPKILISTPDNFLKLDCSYGISDPRFLQLLMFPVGGGRKCEAKLVGSWDGLIAALIKDNGVATFGIWNAISRTVYTIEAPLLMVGSRFEEFVSGFAMNKIVLIVSDSNRRRVHPLTLVHTINEDGWLRKGVGDWRIIEESVPCLFHPPSAPGVYLKNAIHWRPCADNFSSDPTKIIGFDLKGESYRRLALPEVILGDPDNFYTLGVLQDCLTVSLHEILTPSIQILMMKVYGNSDSWVTIFKIPRQCIPILLRQTFKPLCITRYGGLLGFLNQNSVLSFNSRNRTTEIRRIYDIFNQSDAIELLESRSAENGQD